MLLVLTVHRRIHMAFGDHIYVVRPAGYRHHGVDIGNGRVIHRSAIDGTKQGSVIRETSIEDFLAGGEEHVCAYGRRHAPEAAVARAKSALGQDGYDLASNNCEHFATWCVAGEHASAQVETTLSAVRLVGVGVGGPSAGITVVTTLGQGNDLSGPNLMSGLARLGGNVVAGTVLSAGAVGLATTYGMCRLLPDRDFLTHEERVARRIGRYAAGAGAIGGAGASVYALGALGIAGYSAPGLTTGFAALGATVGAGMGAGVIVTIALPALFVGTARLPPLRTLATVDPVGPVQTARASLCSPARTSDQALLTPRAARPVRRG
jgi:hypothetical protein